ncbi:Ferrichrome-iron receptor precursor [Lacunisphaera limnophila]|uniref:Ferrichrome-iron receptor n=2 Tax=Lacunisphaera limnophila TaxID=1838286 RepID=A0A1D8ARU5_9BACT|nr:Ferrichrome-iron receptor precursor [Lacunisphaera limnophila]
MLGTIVLSSTWGFAQTTAQPVAQASEEDVLVLSPFEVSADDDTGYSTATTLAGNRLNTELRDIGNAVTVINSQFLRDIGATSNESLLQYTVGTEVGNLSGNFAGTGDGSFLDESSRFVNPNQNTRVRGLAAADNTRDYFLSDIPWDGFNVDRVDLQRGPNSILFGQGSPAGIINVGLKQASYRNANEVGFQTDQYGSARVTVDFNRVILKDELAVRLMAVNEQEKFQQDPAFEDDKRYMGAVRWEPKFLRKGSARTIVKASFEKGDISSNRPRTLPPLDLITPWFKTGSTNGTFIENGRIRDPATGVVRNVSKGDLRVIQNLNKQTFNPHVVMDDNSGRDNHGQARQKINGGANSGQLSPYYQPWLGNYGQQFGGPNAFFATDGGTPSYWIWETRETRGLNSSGGVDGGVGESAFHRPVGIATASSFARAAGLPYSEFGIYKNIQLADASVFDFYNNLLDGPNKSEWSGFDSFSASIAQTFMDDKFGFEVVYNQQNYDNGQLALLDGERQAIYIDIMSVYSDGTAAGKDGIPFQNGTPNPNVGRPFVTDSGQGGNRSYESSRESMRATAFFTHDFTKKSSDSMIANFLGRHTFTGLYAEDTLEREDRSWQRYAVLDDGYRTLFDGGNGIRFTDNGFAVNRVIYLGGSLAGASTASGAYLPRLQNLNNATSGTIRFFDSTWNAPGVDPGAFFENQYYPVGSTNRNSTQSENHANYVGWSNKPFTITDSETSQQNRDLLTNSARLRRNKTESKAFVWQAHLFNGGLVGTYGYREDTAGSAEYSQNASGINASAPGNAMAYLKWGSNYSLDAAKWNELDGTSRSYSIVAHLDELPVVKNLAEKLPVRVSFFYNKAENFQPFAGRVDIYNQEIPLPAGTTKDLGILLETKDGKYSLKVNKYETAVTDASSSGLGGTWFLGASQAWSGDWVNVFEYNWTGFGDSAGISTDPTYSRANWTDAPDREAASIAAWRAWQQDPIAKKMYAAWGINPATRTGMVSNTTPTGFALTEDSFSEGYEVEFNAQPTRNWRLTLNASKTFASRKNIGGANLAEFVAAYDTFLNKTATDINGATFRPGGDLRIWWGGAGNETALFQWNQNVGSEYAARALQEGTNVPEMREWRVNAISNYDFSEGRLKGVNVGGALRWQSDVVIGYAPIPNPTNPSKINFDIANPYKGPAETDVDLWVGYGRKLFNKVDWRIQLNVRSVGKGNSLIPITVQPDGSPAGYRIAPRQYWSLSNNFRF